MSEFVANGRQLTSGLPRQPSSSQTTLWWVAAATTLLLAITRACNTDDLTFLHRVALWSVIVSLNLSQPILLKRCVTGFFVRDQKVTSLFIVLVTTVLMTIELQALKYTPLLPKQPDPWLAFYGFVAPLAGVFALLALYLDTTTTTHIVDKTTLSSRPETSRPAGWPTGTVLYVSAEDHYVTVATSSETKLLRGTFRSVLETLSREEGMQVHRSHWVSRAGAVRLIRRGRDTQLLTASNTLLPVSRSRLRDVRAFIANS